MKLANAPDIPPAQLTRMVRSWVLLNWFRFALLLMTWMAALKAFSYGA
jgi:hypothetical protein